MSKAFDQAAKSYDEEFTNTRIGRIQRDRVWKYIAKVFLVNDNARILEVNCGTGEDAIHLAELGHNVLATDQSEEMLSQTRKKVVERGLTDRIEIKHLDLSKPQLVGEDKFDIIFSNFGGLNCLNADQLKTFSSFCKSNLKKEGICVFVVMPKETFLEKLYRVWSGERSKYEQRKSENGIMVNLGKRQVTTHFYNVADLKKLFIDLRYIDCAPISFIPSYFNKSRLLPLFIFFDKIALSFNSLVDKADHLIVQFRRID